MHIPARALVYGFLVWLVPFIVSIGLFPLEDHVTPEGDVGAQIIEGSRYAIARHHGPSDTIAQTYHRLCGEWLPQSGKELRGNPALEFYLNSPRGVRPEELLTDVCMPLES